jgi:hypothetical protein
MAVTEHESGTKATTLDTEHVLNTTTPETTDGVFQLFIDVNAMVAGDVTLIRIKEKTISGGTQRRCKVYTLVGAQSDPLWVSEAFMFLHGWDMTIEQTDGTARSYPWSIRKAA